MKRASPLIPSLLMVLLLALVACVGGPDSLTDPLAAAQSVPAGPAPLPGENVQPRHFTITPGSSQASYSVREELFGQSVGSRISVGGTAEVEGSMILRIDPSNGGVALGDNRITVNLESLTSNESRRDNRIRTEWLESNRYPLATFFATEIRGFPTGARDGQAITFQLAGNLTVREVTRPVTFITVATLNGDTISGTASTLLYMRDFGFEPPSVMGVLAVTDGVTVTLQFSMRET